jgi:hypothetical protein
MAAPQASIPGARSAPAPLKERAAGRSGYSPRLQAALSRSRRHRVPPAGQDETAQRRRIRVLGPEPAPAGGGFFFALPGVTSRDTWLGQRLLDLD